MKPADDIKRLINQSHITTGPDTDERILADALNDLSQLKQKRSAQPKPNVWRIIMKSRMIKLSATVLIIIAVLIVLNKYSGSNHIGLLNVALAKASEALEEVSWVHITLSGKSDDKDHESEERWASNKSHITVIRRNDGTIFFRDYVKNLKYQYNPQTNEVVTSKLTEKFRPVPVQWEEFVKEYGNIPHKMNFSYKEDIVDENRVNVFKVSWIEESGVRRESEYVVDIESSLPITCNGKSLYSDGTILSEMTRIFDYPQEGPATIYELGVPKDAEFYDDSSESLESLGIAQSEIDESAGRLLALGKALFIYANDHAGEYPDTLQNLKGYLDDLQWLIVNVEYLGRGKKATDPPNIEMAYDRTLLEKVGRTNIVYIDIQVIFERPTTFK